LKPKKPNRTELKLKKPSQTKKTSQAKKTKPNRFEPVFILNKPNRTETDRFEPVSVFFKKNSVWLLFFDKNRTELKIITPNSLSTS
jgi:hypothetical protein